MGCGGRGGRRGDFFVVSCFLLIRCAGGRGMWIGGGREGKRGEGEDMVEGLSLHLTKIFIEGRGK